MAQERTVEGPAERATTTDPREERRARRRKQARQADPHSPSPESEKTHDDNRPPSP